MNWIRWKIFKALSHLAWWICPEPHRHNLGIIWQTRMDDYKQAIADAKRELKEISS
jgi:hypothetical protein